MTLGVAGERGVARNVVAFLRGEPLDERTLPSEYAAQAPLGMTLGVAGERGAGQVVGIAAQAPLE